MHLSLFSRLTVGYLAIFAIVAAASTYAIVELTVFGNQAESILRIDNRVLDHEKFLTDLLLAQSRAEQKYVISRDEAWYLQFMRLKIDFESRAESAASVAGEAPELPLVGAAFLAHLGAKPVREDLVD